jgi:hypothetical protein
MMKRFGFACVTFASLAACAAEPEPQPEPQPDPALVQRVAERAAPRAPELAKADRLVAAVDRSDPDRLAAPARALLQR